MENESQLPLEQKLYNWEKSVADELGILYDNDPVYVELRSIFNKRNFSGEAGAKALEALRRHLAGNSTRIDAVRYIKQEFKHNK